MDTSRMWSKLTPNLQSDGSPWFQRKPNKTKRKQFNNKAHVNNKKGRRFELWMIASLIQHFFNSREKRKKNEIKHTSTSNDMNKTENEEESENSFVSGLLFTSLKFSWLREWECAIAHCRLFQFEFYEHGERMCHMIKVCERTNERA